MHWGIGKITRTLYIRVYYMLCWKQTVSEQTASVNNAFFELYFVFHDYKLH